MSDEPDTDRNPVPEPNPFENIRGIIPRTFTREDLGRATKRAKNKNPKITWAEAKRRAMAWFKAMVGAPAYDNTVLFAPPVRKSKVKPARKISGLWWHVTMKTNKERAKAREAREAILKKVGANIPVEANDGANET